MGQQVGARHGGENLLFHDAAGEQFIIVKHRKASHPALVVELQKILTVHVFVDDNGGGDLHIGQSGRLHLFALDHPLDQVEGGKKTGQGHIVVQYHRQPDLLAQHAAGGFQKRGGGRKGGDISKHAVADDRHGGVFRRLCFLVVDGFLVAS